jgi:hypothetical protein
MKMTWKKKKIMLPMHYFEKCSKRLEKNTAEKFKELAGKSKNKKNIANEEKENIFNIEIRKTFIYFFSCILLRYQTFCKTYEKLMKIIVMSDTSISNSYNNNCLETTSNSKIDSSSKDERNDSFMSKRTNIEEKRSLNKLRITDIFRCKHFIEDTDTPKLDRPFYKRFFETQIFFKFIKKKIFPNSTQDKLDILYFDYKINEKLARGSRKLKIDTKFFNEEIEKLGGEITINSLKKEPSEKMYNFLHKNKNNCKNAVNYFQKIMNNNKHIKENEKEDKNNISIDNDNNCLNDSIRESYLKNDNDNDNDNDNNSDSESGFCIISLHQVYEDVGSELSNATKKLEGNNDAEEEKNKKLLFYYYVFPKLLNDNKFFRENLIYEELESKNIWIKNNSNFNIKNCNCLYNQFEKEANAFINKPIIQLNYQTYGYNINIKWEKIYNYEECINTLWLLYLAKSFESISHSKKRYYFEEILMFLNDKNNKVDPDVILTLFTAINKYGDRNMNQELFLYLETKNYINFLCLREKTKSDNNFVRYINSSSNSKNFYLEKNRGSFTGDDTSNKVPILDIDVFFTKEKKTSPKKKLFDFYVYSYCCSSLDEIKVVDEKSKDESLNIDKDKEKDNDNTNDNNVCGELLLFNIKDLFLNDINKKYIELECPKCKKTQKITITCIFNDDNDNAYQINFNLLSPLALRREPWFKNSTNLNLSYISSEYTEDYLSAIFYFYEQGLPCNFLIPKGKINRPIRQERATTYNNIDPIEDLYASYFCHKKSFSILQTPRLTKREINISERMNIFDFKKGGQKGITGAKSPSPKKGSLKKRTSKFAQKLRSAELDIKQKVTFSAFKK